MTDYLYIAYLPPAAAWIHGLIAALRACQSRQLRGAFEDAWQPRLVPLALAVATKLELVSSVITRMDEVLHRLASEVHDSKLPLDAYLARGAGFQPNDRALPYDILATIDAFFYECRSTYEVVGKFTREFSEVFLVRPLTQDAIRQELRERGLDDAWIEDLKGARISFFHSTAPWFALKLVSREPLRMELVVLREHQRIDGDPSKTISFEQLRSIAGGLESAMTRIQVLLVSRLRKRDEELLRGESA